MTLASCADKVNIQFGAQRLVVHMYMPLKINHGDSSDLFESTMYMLQPALVCIDAPLDEYMNLKLSFCAAWV